MIRDQVVQQVQEGQGRVRILLRQFAVEGDGSVVVGQVPVPDDMAFRLLQDPLAVLLAGIHADGFLRVAAGMDPGGVHPVPPEEGDQAGRPFLIGFGSKLRLQEFLVLPVQVLGQFFLKVQAVLNAVHALLDGQVEQVVNRDAEYLGQQRQQGDVRHRDGVLPFGDRLGADAKPVCQLFLGKARPEAELSDFLSEFHKKSPPECVCFPQLHPDCKACISGNQ